MLRDQRDDHEALEGSFDGHSHDHDREYASPRMDVRNFVSNLKGLRGKDYSLPHRPYPQMVLDSLQPAPALIFEGNAGACAGERPDRVRDDHFARRR